MMYTAQQTTDLAALKQVMNAVDTIPVSTAECERGFSKMNIVCTSLRSRLSVMHMSSLMFISLSGPPLSSWKPLPFVKSWISLLQTGEKPVLGRDLTKQKLQA